MGKRVTLKEAERFHGHLGPYLILGILAGELAIKNLRGKKYFGLEVEVYGANKKPKSCLIDGLQLSTGATYGKSNIQKVDGNKIKILFCNLKNHKKISLSLKDSLVMVLNSLRGHQDAELFARQLYQINPLKIFNLTTDN